MRAQCVLWIWHRVMVSNLEKLTINCQEITRQSLVSLMDVFKVYLYLFLWLGYTTERWKAEPFLLWRWVGTNGSPKERWTTDYMSTVSAEVPVILLFLTRSSKKFEKRSYSSKTWIFIKQSITWSRDFLIFFISYFILSENNNSVKKIPISADNDISPLGRCIFKRRNLSI